jgi:CRP/FNR family transcriptional regulator, dissimilatory nitrate respiration regulator
MIDYQLLGKCPVFKGIPENESKNLLGAIHYRIRNYKKGELVALAGEPVDNLIIILTGSVRGDMIDYSGRILKIEDVDAPRPIAAAFLFGNDNRFPVTVTANSNVKILAIPVKEFLKLLQKNTRLLTNYLNSISSRSQFLSGKLHFLSFKTIRGKVAHYVLQNTGNRLHSFEMKMTQQQLAELFGVTRPSLARVLGEMQQERMIIIDRKTVTLLNRNRLNEILQNG